MIKQGHVAGALALILLIGHCVILGTIYFAEGESTELKREIAALIGPVTAGSLMTALVWASENRRKMLRATEEANFLYAILFLGVPLIFLVFNGVVVKGVFIDLNGKAEAAKITIGLIETGFGAVFAYVVNDVFDRPGDAPIQNANGGG